MAKICQLKRISMIFKIFAHYCSFAKSGLPQKLLLKKFVTGFVNSVHLSAQKKATDVKTTIIPRLKLPIKPLQEVTNDGFKLESVKRNVPPCENMLRDLPSLWVLFWKHPSHHMQIIALSSLQNLFSDLRKWKENLKEPFFRLLLLNNHSKPHVHAEKKYQLQKSWGNPFFNWKPSITCTFWPTFCVPQPDN